MGRMHRPDPKLPADQQDKRSAISIEQGDVYQWLAGTVKEAQELLRVKDSFDFVSWWSHGPRGIAERCWSRQGACDEPTDAVGNSGSTNDRVVETIRVRDCDQDPALYDPTTGEVFRRPQPARRHQQAVDTALAGLKAIQVRQTISLSVED